MPLTYASTLDRSGVNAAARHRGGVLEPGARVCFVNAQAKAAANSTASITAPKRARTFLSQAGPRLFLDLLQAEHHLVPSLLIAQNAKGDPLGSPSLELLCG
jgi:hypothetical protein